MFYYEVCEIGRESVKSVNASVLATIIKELVNKYEKNHKSKLQNRRYYIKCREKLEFTPKKHKKIGDDEGFESDANEEDSLSGDLSNEDAQSTASSCCLVEDHVFKSGNGDRNSYARDLTSLVSIIGSVDSANSSGGSDSDELEMHSLTPSPVNQSKKLLTTHEYLFETNESDPKLVKNKREEYPIEDVIFCHTEPKYPTVIAWVIKKHQAESDFGSRLGIKGVECFSKMENCLEVIVVKCKNSNNLKELCSNYQEYSRRIKLDQYKSIKRKKDDEKKSSSLSPLIGSKDVKVSLSDMKIASSGLIKASELSILNPKIMTSFKTDLKNSVSLNSLIKPENAISQSMKTTLEIKSSTNHDSSVKKTQSLLNLSKTWELKSDTLSRNGNLYRDNSPDLGDQFNLIQRTDLNGVTHLEVSKTRDAKMSLVDRFSNKSKLRKEIEGVILTDVESYAKKEQVRQRQGMEDGGSDTPPIRPERKKYLKKKTLAPSPPVSSQSPDVISTLSGSREKQQKGSFYLTPQTNESRDEKVLKGPYVRVQSWGNQNIPETNYGSWKAEPKTKHISKYEEKCIDRRRSKSASRAPKKTPMAYRYVDITNDYRGSPTMKCGIPQKVREVGGNLTNTVHNIRRRNSFDDIIGFDNHKKGNLKSVIKKSKKINDKYCEPKKVTFSAYATVQVVD